MRQSGLSTCCHASPAFTGHPCSVQLGLSSGSSPKPATALLFQAGQALIAFYLVTFISANIYGAAAGVIVLLIWVYYAAMIFLLGAEFTKIWTHYYGVRRQED